MGKFTNNSNSRDWTQIYSIYGIDQWQTLLFLLLHSLLFTLLSLLSVTYFNPLISLFHTLLSLPPSLSRFAAAFSAAFAALSALCLLFSAANFLHSSLTLHHDMSQKIVNTIPDWSTVKHALDIGCGRGILLNAVATKLKKAGSAGRVVGLDRSKMQTLATLRRAHVEGVGEYVTCREGDARNLPFGDNSFDVVVSAVFVHRVGKEYGEGSAAAAAERMRTVGEVVRVLKPGGRGVVWDLKHVAEYVRRLQELRMEEVRVSEEVTAFMVSSQIVSFRKPSELLLGPGEVRLDWRC